MVFTTSSGVIRRSTTSARFSSKGWPNSYQTALHLTEAIPLELYEVYQTKVAASDERIAAILERLQAQNPPPATALPPPRRAQPQANEPAVPVHEALHAILGVDL